MRALNPTDPASHRHTLGIEPTETNLRHAAHLRTAAQNALKTGSYRAADFFSDSYPIDTGNMAFVATQIGNADYLITTIYSRWIKSASSSELQRT